MLGPAWAFHKSSNLVVLFAELVAEDGEHADRGPKGRLDGRSGVSGAVSIFVSMS